MTQLVFVYGTLRRGEVNHHYLATAKFVAQWCTLPEYALFDLGPYPALIKGQQSIQGELYWINRHTLAELDELEDVPVEYRRERIETPFGLAWVYLFQNDRELSVLIPSGDWCQRGGAARME